VASVEWGIGALAKGRGFSARSSYLDDDYAIGFSDGSFSLAKIMNPERTQNHDDTSKNT